MLLDLYGARDAAAARKALREHWADFVAVCKRKYAEMPPTRMVNIYLDIKVEDMRRRSVIPVMHSINTLPHDTGRPY